MRMKKIYVGVVVNLPIQSRATPDYVKALVEDYLRKNTKGMTVQAHAFELKEAGIWDEIVEFFNKIRGGREGKR